jgi:hypothetical protein
MEGRCADGACSFHQENTIKGPFALTAFRGVAQAIFGQAENGQNCIQAVEPVNPESGDRLWPEDERRERESETKSRKNPLQRIRLPSGHMGITLVRVNLV